MSRLKTADFYYLALLRQGSFERRRSAWRFGTCRLSAHIIDRLVAAGRARIDGDCVRLVPREATP